MVTFSMILASESAMNVLIQRRLGTSWIDRLDNHERTRVERFYEKRRKTNTEVSILECLMLSHRLALLKCCPEVIGAVGFDSIQAFARWEKSLGGLRNSLAHGGGLLHAEPNPLRAVELFRNVRSFAECL